MDFPLLFYCFFIELTLINDIFIQAIDGFAYLENINELTVIANDNFAHFADRLQKDFNDSMSFKKDEVTPEILSITLKNAGVPIEKITPQLIEKFREELFIAGIINPQDMLTRDANKIDDKIDFQDPVLREHALMIIKAFKESMLEKGTSKIEIRNGDNEITPNGQHSYVSEDSFKKIFKALAEKLAKRTIYKLDLDKRPAEERQTARCYYLHNPRQKSEVRMAVVRIDRGVS